MRGKSAERITNGGVTSRPGILSGLAFAALLVVVRVIEGSGLPDADAPTATVVRYWSEHRSDQMTIAVLASLAAVLLVWFGGELRSRLARAEGGDGRLANITFGGALLGAAGMLGSGGVEFAAADSAGRVPGQVTQALSALQADTFLMIAGGFAVFGVAAGLAILRTGALSRSLGWLSLGAGILWLTPAAFVAIFLSLLFAAIASVVTYRAASTARAPAPIAGATRPTEA
jgi:hypothetical protein